MIYDKQGIILVCPGCGSGSVGYDLNQKRYKCLARNCLWMMKNECEIGDYSALVRESDFIGGSE